MERNNESGNRSYNDRNRNQYNANRDWNQSSDFQQERNRESENSDRLNDREDYRDYASGGQSSYGDRMRNQGNSEWNRNQGNNDSNRNQGYDSDWNRSNRNDYGLRSGAVRYRDNEWDRSRDNNNGRNWWDKTKDEVSGWFGDEDAQRRRDSDERAEHRGKGPKGYTRSDERIKEDIHERLTYDGQVDAREIEVEVTNGEVSLKGTVNTRQEKRRAEDISENVSGVKNVENHIKVGSQTPDFKNGSLREKNGGLEYGSAGSNARSQYSK